MGCEGADEEVLPDTLLLQTGLQKSGAHGGSSVFKEAPLGPVQAKRSAKDGAPVMLQATEAAGLSQEVLRALTGSMSVDASGASQMVMVVVVILVMVAALLVVLAMPVDDPEEGPSGGKLLEKPEATGASARYKEEPRPSTLPRHSALPRPGTSLSPPLGSGYLPPTSGMPTAPPMEFDDGPPPICASLILPNTEARFMISMESLLSITTGSVDVLGTSGRKLLNASIYDLPDGSRSLALASDGCEGDPRVVISAPAARGNEPMPRLLVFGRGGRPYGTLEASGDGTILRFQGVHVLRLEPGPAADLAIRAMSTGCRELGKAGRGIGGGKRGGDPLYWGLVVKPGADAVLIACCMLATLLLVPSSSRLSLPSLRPRPSTLSERSAMASVLPSFAQISTIGDAGK